MKSEIVKHSDEIAASESDEDVGLTINTSQVSTLATPFSASSSVYRGPKGSMTLMWRKMLSGKWFAIILMRQK